MILLWNFLVPQKRSCSFKRENWRFLNAVCTSIQINTFNIWITLLISFFTLALIDVSDNIWILKSCIPIHASIELFKSNYCSWAIILSTVEESTILFGVWDHLNRVDHIAIIKLCTLQKLEIPYYFSLQDINLEHVQVIIHHKHSINKKLGINVFAKYWVLH